MFIHMIQEKELKIGQMIAMSKQIFAANLKTIVFILLIIFFPISLMSGLIDYQVYEMGVFIDFNAIMNDPGLFQEFVLSPVYGKLMVYNLLDYLLQIFCAPLGIMSIAWMTKCVVEEEQITYKNAIVKASERIPTMLLASFLCLLLITGGCLLLIIPGILLSFWFYFFEYAIILKGDTAFGSLMRSAGVFSGSFFKVVGVLIVFSILQFCINYGINFLFVLGTDSFAINILVKMLSFFFGIFFYIASTILFLNRCYTLERKKREKMIF